jgi:hypothetical protein
VARPLPPPARGLFRGDRLEAALAEARKPALLRLLEALRRW